MRAPSQRFGRRDLGDRRDGARRLPFPRYQVVLGNVGSRAKLDFVGLQRLLLERLKQRSWGLGRYQVQLGNEVAGARACAGDLVLVSSSRGHLPENLPASLDDGHGFGLEPFSIGLCGLATGDPIGLLLHGSTGLSLRP